MPSIDYFLWGSYVVSALEGLVLILAMVRTVQVARGLATILFRRRAYLMGALLLLLLVGTIANYFPSPGASTDIVAFLISLVGEVSFLGALLVALVFVDQNLLVLREVDFFHADTLRWSALRRPAYVVLVAATGVILSTSILAGPSGFSSGPLYSIGIAVYFPVVAVVLGYAAVALVVGAKRSPDRTMKKFAFLLGISLAFGVVATTIWIPLSLVTTASVGNFISTFPSVFSAYFLYLAAMSLSPLGRVRRDEARVYAAGEGPAPGKRLIDGRRAPALDG